MIVHFIRHAQAIKRSSTVPDELRYLSCRGRKRFRKVSCSLHKQKIDPDYIFASTKTRAVQTADVLAETLAFQGEVIVTPLLNDFSLQSLNDLLQQYPSAEEFAIVGHDPDFSNAVRQLLNLSSCTVTKGCAVTLNIITDQQALKADITSLITAGAKTVCSPHKAIAWLQKDHKNMQEGEPKCLIP